MVEIEANELNKLNIFKDKWQVEVEKYFKFSSLFLHENTNSDEKTLIKDYLISVKSYGSEINGYYFIDFDIIKDVMLTCADEINNNYLVSKSEYESNVEKWNSITNKILLPNENFHNQYLVKFLFLRIVELLKQKHYKTISAYSKLYFDVSLHPIGENKSFKYSNCI